jgi:hypothetical protein
VCLFSLFCVVFNLSVGMLSVALLISVCLLCYFGLSMIISCLLIIIVVERLLHFCGALSILSVLLWIIMFRLIFINMICVLYSIVAIFSCNFHLCISILFGNIEKCVFSYISINLFAIVCIVSFIGIVRLSWTVLLL